MPSLRPQVVFKKPCYGTKYVFTPIMEIVQQISNTKGSLQLSEMIPTCSSWLIADGSFLLACYFSKVFSWIATHPTRTQRVILCEIARHLDMLTPPSHPLISFENDSSPVVTANGSHISANLPSFLVSSSRQGVSFLLSPCTSLRHT